MKESQRCYFDNCENEWVVDIKVKTKTPHLNTEMKGRFCKEHVKAAFEEDYVPLVEAAFK